MLADRFHWLRSWRPVKRAPLWIALVWFGAACATTNIQTGGTNYQDPHRVAEEDPEAQFFSELSAQDDAYGDGALQETAATDEECPCDTGTTVAERDSVEETQQVAAVTDDAGYFENAHRPAEERPREQATQEERLPASGSENTGGGTESEDEQSFENNLAGNFFEVGTASWYGRDFDGRPTASGEIFDSRKLSAAHKELPLGSIVMVRNMDNNKEVLVTINDRGPFVGGRIIDMSEYGAELLGYKEKGLTTVGIRVIRAGSGSAPQEQGATYQYFSNYNSYGGSDSDTEEATQAILERDAEGRESEQPVEVQRERDFQFYSVQVGSFSELRNARNLQRYLEHLGFPVHVLQRDDMYLVKVGSFASRREAEDAKHKMHMEGYTQSFVATPAN